MEYNEIYSFLDHSIVSVLNGMLALFAYGFYATGKTELTMTLLVLAIVIGNQINLTK